jgi:prolipoprotein diacylglyceryltransferase
MVLARYLIFAGGIRFLIEFVRVNAHVAGPLTLAQLWSAALIAAGLVLTFRRSEVRRAIPAR